MSVPAETAPSAEAEGFELVTLPGGVRSLRARANGEVFHPVVGPVAEAQAVHVDGGRLVERAAALGAGETFVIWDVGLGAAANALTAIDALLAAGERLRGRRVALVSFDRSDAALRFARRHAAALGYPSGREPWLDVLLGGTAVNVAAGNDKDALTLRWVFVNGDFASLTAADARAAQPAPHAIFYDPYSPTANPEMWTLPLFARVRARLAPATPCVLTTYSRSTAVRVTLLLAGFCVGSGAATGEKEETTAAASDLALLARPLDRRWLEVTVRGSTNAAPLRAGSAATRGPISAEDFRLLTAHAQFRPQ